MIDLDLEDQEFQGIPKELRGILRNYLSKRNYGVHFSLCGLPLGKDVETKFLWVYVGRQSA